MLPSGGELIRLQVLFSLTGLLLLVLTGFSPKSTSLHPSDFGEDPCQFM
jgi:hypothetical protein